MPIKKKVAGNASVKPSKRVSTSVKVKEVEEAPQQKQKPAAKKKAVVAVAPKKSAVKPSSKVVKKVVASKGSKKPVAKKEPVKSEPKDYSEMYTRLLQGLAEGYTTKELADDEGLSHRTIETHLAIMREEWGALNTINMVAMAVADGTVEL